MAAVLASINVSKTKGHVKTPVASAVFDNSGIQGDAHAGPGPRQISLLAKEHVSAFGKQYDRKFKHGDFAENLTTDGIDLDQVGVSDILIVGSATLEITQIGKTCHGDGCAIFAQVGVCVMPKQGLFARVIKGGTVAVGDSIKHIKRPFRVTIVTVSDRASQGIYEDKSGPAIQSRIEAHCKPLRKSVEWDCVVVPDEAEAIETAVKNGIHNNCHAIFTTGGTGIGPRDITPDVVRPLISKELPGIMEAVRVNCGQSIPNALLSRSIAGCTNQSLIYCLPGSVRAVNEYLDVILATLNHALEMIAAIDSH